MQLWQFKADIYLIGLVYYYKNLILLLLIILLLIICVRILIYHNMVDIDINLSDPKVIGIMIGIIVVILLLFICLLRTFCPCWSCIVDCLCNLCKCNTCKSNDDK